ncbi:MAG: tetratricopeptide repeat protein, partial [Anaerolineales bacterium]
MGAADSYFQKADLALKKHNYDYAIELFLQGLMIEPKATDKRRRLHQIEVLAVQEKGGNPQGGLANRMKTMPHELQAKKLHMQKKYDEEVLELEKVVRLQPQNVGSLAALAQALENLEVYDGAISVCEEITTVDKTHVEAYRKMGKLYDKLGDPDKAIAAWEKVKLYKPDDKEAGKAVRDLSAAQMVKKQEERKQAGGDESFRALLKDQSEAEDLQKKQMIIRTDE